MFLAASAFESSPSTPHKVGREIVIDATRIRGLQRDYSLANHTLPGESETRMLVDKLVTEEILFREGLARGFEQGDRSIAWRLAQKMRYLGEDHGEDNATLYRKALAMGLHKSDPIVRRILVEKLKLIVGRAAPPATDTELAAWYSTHTRNYEQAARVSLVHVYFDRTRRGAEGAKQAAVAAAANAEGHGKEIAPSLGGDPFVMGTTLAAQSSADLGKFFGPSFASEAMLLPEGKWSEPLDSTFGTHLVWIDKRFDARVPDLSEVRTRVEKGYQNERREDRIAAFLESVRPEYSVSIDEEAIRGARRG